jgi:hypothetical protein
LKNIYPELTIQSNIFALIFAQEQTEEEASLGSEVGMVQIYRQKYVSILQTAD